MPDARLYKVIELTELPEEGQKGILYLIGSTSLSAYIWNGEDFIPFSGGGGGGYTPEELRDAIKFEADEYLSMPRIICSGYIDNNAQYLNFSFAIPFGTSASTIDVMGDLAINGINGRLFSGRLSDISGVITFNSEYEILVSIPLANITLEATAVPNTPIALFISNAYLSFL